MTTQELRDKRRTLNLQADAILKKAHDDKREILTGEEEQEWQRLHDEMDALKRHIDKLEAQAKRTEEIEEVQPRQTAPNPVGAPADERRGDRNSQAGMRYLRQGQADMARALRAWLLYPAPGVTLSAEDRSACERVGVNLASKSLAISLSTMPMRSLRGDDQREWEYRAQAVGTGSAGGFAVPDELMRAFERAMLTFGGMRQRCTVIRTETGADLPWPTANDTSQKGQIIAENAAANEQDVTFAQLVLNSYLYSSKMIRVSVQLLQDAAINVAAVLGDMLGERIARITNEHFTTGTGSGQPNGIVTAATVGFTASNGTSQVTTWTYPSIVELEHSVDPAHRLNGAFMMADSSVKKTKQIVDSTGRPLWAAGIAGGAPDTLLGYPIVVNQDVAAMAAGAKSVVFGDLSKYLIRDVLGVQLLRLDERYAEFHQVAFLAFARHDGDLLNAGTNPVKVFVNAAS
jgi:HK97 family phage major capsid protein